MCLPVPTVQNSEEIEQWCQFGVAQITQARKARTIEFDFRRFAPSLYGGALPRTPASFRLSSFRFAERQS